ncbi:hypothetical protein BASA60_003376 [Batrachochytrium salamandrivorans]|nr:hypothetical protein BASA60_003376 [Batrachochytrium salamandrivorans]KAH9248102.1 hypothetical protein BASA81_014265 [Batrachochytrium salamandrivorans]KAH9271448.1 hypothetical protein BASA83_006291 [Batrachochytrium salamandrivorans]
MLEDLMSDFLGVSNSITGDTPTLDAATRSLESQQQPQIQQSQHSEPLSHSSSLMNHTGQNTMTSNTNVLAQLLLQQQLQLQLQQQQLEQQQLVETHIKPHDDNGESPSMEQIFQSLLPLMQAQQQLDTRIPGKPQSPVGWVDQSSNLFALTAIKAVNDAINMMSAPSGPDALQPTAQHLQQHQLQQPFLEKHHIPELQSLLSFTPTAHLNQPTPSIPSLAAFASSLRGPGLRHPYFDLYGRNEYAGPYVQKACGACKLAHTACDNQRPCQRCIRNHKESECVDASRRKRGRPSNIERASREKERKALNLDPLISSKVRRKRPTVKPSSINSSAPVVPGSALDASFTNEIEGDDVLVTEASHSGSPPVSAMLSDKGQKRKKQPKPPNRSASERILRERARKSSRNSSAIQRHILPFLPLNPPQNDMSFLYQRPTVPSGATNTQPAISNDILLAFAALSVLLPETGSAPSSDLHAIAAAAIASAASAIPQCPSQHHLGGIDVPLSNSSLQHTPADLRQLVQQLALPYLQQSSFDPILNPRGTSVPDTASVSTDHSLLSSHIDEETMSLLRNQVAAALQQAGVFDALLPKQNVSS